MRWVSHIAIGASCASLGGFELIPAAAAGAIAPDAAERYLNVTHRQETHFVIVWIVALVAGIAAYRFNHSQIIIHFSAFAFGGLSHCLTDALTISGVPFSPWSKNRFHLAGGRLRTGSFAEYIIAAVFVLAVWTVHNSVYSAGGFYPFFYDWGGLYDAGLIDGSEWKQNRLKFF